jgi:transcription initiation factor TFIID subunit 9B
MRKRYEFFEAPPRDVSFPDCMNEPVADDKFLAEMAHELNQHPLPTLPESFDVIRLPPPHQRLAEVNFDLLPDQSISYDDIRRNGNGDDEDDESESSEEEEEEEGTVDGEAANGDIAEDDAEGEDDDMEEVAMEPAAPRQDREMDEDYDA